MGAKSFAVRWAMLAGSLLVALACSEEPSEASAEGLTSPSAPAASGGDVSASGAPSSNALPSSGAAPGSGGSPSAGAMVGSAGASDGSSSGGAQGPAGVGGTGGIANPGATGMPAGAGGNSSGGDTGRAGAAGSGVEVEPAVTPEPDEAPGPLVDAGEPPVESPVVDPNAPLTAVAFYPSKDRMDTCADAAISIEFNRPPLIGRGQIRILDSSGEVFDSVTANPTDLYFSALAPRSSGGQSFDSEVLDVVFNTVVFHLKGKLQLGETYSVSVDEGVISDDMGTPFAVGGAEWTFTVRAEDPMSSDTYTLDADGSGDYCSIEGVLQALPNTAMVPRVVTVGRGVYPGVVRMSDSNVHFRGQGIDVSVLAHKNAATMNSSREGIVLTGSDVTFEALTIFNTYRADSNGQQAEALYVTEQSQRVFLDGVHLRSHQDTLRVDGPSVYMRGGKISGSTDPLWGYGGFFCDGCELASRTSGHAFVVARSTLGFALTNCSVTRDVASVNNTYLAQSHDGAEPGKIAFIGCQIDDHIVGWRMPQNKDWFEYGNTDLDGNPVVFDGTQLSAGSPVLADAESPQSWLGWSP